MEVKSAIEARLSNFEVQKLLNELKSNAQSSQYLQNSNPGQTEDHVKSLLSSLLKFPVPLTEPEKLMLVNTPPKTTLELSLIINNYDERLSEVEVEQLLALIAANSP